MPFVFNKNFHGIDTRQSYKMRTHRVSHSFTEKCVRYNLPKLVNDTSPLVFEKLFTQSLDGFANYFNRFFISNYPEYCEIINCYICHR